MKPIDPESKSTSEFEESILTLAMSIAKHYNANVANHEIEKICDEGDVSWCLDIYVSEVPIETVIKMNIELATEITKIHNKKLHKKPLFFMNPKQDSNKNEINEKDIVPLFILLEEIVENNNNARK